MFIINDAKATIILENFGSPAENHPPEQLYGLREMVQQAVKRKKLIHFIDDKFAPEDEIFYVAITLHRHDDVPNKLQCAGNPSRKTKDNKPEHAQSFGAKILGLGGTDSSSSDRQP